MQQSLHGPWRCTLPDGRTLTVDVPGCLERHVEEKDIGGPCRFEREFTLGPLNGQRVVAQFDRVSYYCDVFVNGRLAGSHEGMWDSFYLDITELVCEEENHICLEVTKPGYYDSDRFPLRQVLSGFIPDILCTFCGIWGEASIVVCENFVVDFHHTLGRAGEFLFTMGLRALSGADDPFMLSFVVRNQQGAVVFSTKESVRAGEVQLKGRVNKAALWSPGEGNLYLYECEIFRGNQTEHLAGSFGFRDLHADDDRIVLNDKPLYVRGILHWGLYDLAFTPTPSEDQIAKEIEGIRAYGFNAIKHCLYIPSEEYLSACDKAGILQWVELPLWLPEKTDALDERIRREYPRILRRLLGHPSVALYSLGCELNAAVDGGILSEMYEFIRARSGALVCDNSGSGECYDGLATGYADFFDYHFYADLHNMEPLMESFTPTWRSKKPWLFGEFCDADTLRNMEVIRAEYGVEKIFWESGDPVINPLNTLKPDFTADQYEKNVLQSGVMHDYERMHTLSINHCLTHRKTVLEQTRAFPEISGYNITSLRDMPLSADGMFDEMSRAKFDTEIFRFANDDIVLVPAWDLTRVWMTSDRVQPKDRYAGFAGGTMGWHILVSNYSDKNLEELAVDWVLSQDQKILSGGALTGVRVACGCLESAGAVRFTLPEVTTPETLSLEVTVRGTNYKNRWPVFVYPCTRRFAGQVGLFDPAGVLFGLETMYPVRFCDDTPPADIDVMVTSYMSPALYRWVETGGKLLFCQRGQHGGLPARPVCFWRESFVDRVLTGPFAELPAPVVHEDLRYFGVAAEFAFDLDQFADRGLPNTTSLLTRYDARLWTKTAYVTSTPVGKGKLIATTLKLDGGAGKQPVGVAHNVFSQWFIDSAFANLME